MHELIGVLLIAGACALFVQYRPKSDENQMLCVMMAVMGLVSLLAGQGSLLFTIVQTALALAMGACCAVRVRREFVYRKRRARRIRALHRAPICAGQLRRAG